MLLNKRIITAELAMLLLASLANAQQKPSISGTMGLTYEHYGLSRSPAGWTGFTPRKPYNQFRVVFQPNIQFSKNFSLPFNFNFSTRPTNFAGPYAGIGKQNIGQFITNPMNSFGLNPKYKWAELQLGTQYLNYSDLSTGDIGVFGAGVDLRPGTFRFKFFTGLSQQSVNFFTGPPATTGAYRRRNWMLQLGRENEGKYAVAFNFAYAKDDSASASPPPPSIRPQQGFTLSFVTKLFFQKGWYFNVEGAQSLYTKDLGSPLTNTVKSFEPFIKAHTSTVRDYAGEAGLGHKSKNFDVGVKLKYIGAGFQTPGYPFMQPDRFDYTLNTRFNAWKNKMNVTAALGQRVNNVSNTALKAKQFIGNVNWFTQFSDKFSLNLNFNNFGFQSNSGINPYGIKNVSTDLGISPTYSWSNEKMMHTLTASYNYSKYDERDVITGNITSNNTHMGLLSYVPVFLKKELTPDFSLMYFYNNMPGFKLTLMTFSSGISVPLAKKKINFRGQIQYNYSKTNSFTGNNNILASCNIDWKLTKKLNWNTFIGSNHFKYGNEITPNNARYLESNVRTGLLYRFGK